MSKENKISKFFKGEIPKEIYNAFFNPDSLNQLNENCKQIKEDCGNIIEKLNLEKKY